MTGRELCQDRGLFFLFPHSLLHYKKISLLVYMRTEDTKNNFCNMSDNNDPVTNTVEIPKGDIRRHKRKRGCFLSRKCLSCGVTSLGGKYQSFILKTFESAFCLNLLDRDGLKAVGFIGCRFRDLRLTSL